MIIAGPCLINDKKELDAAIDIAHAIKPFATHFRAKLWGGGTSINRWFPGVGHDGIETLNFINEFLPAGTEVQIPTHIDICNKLDFIWVGCRNIQNYALLQHLKLSRKKILFKRNPGMTLNELINYYDVVKYLCTPESYIVERGIINIDRDEKSRWSINLNSVLKIKNDYPGLFENLIIDCSHSAGDRRHIADIYTAMKAIGVKHFMFECTLDGKSQTDNAQMLSVDKLQNIITG